MAEIKLRVLDAKGNRLGRDYDYEYGGRRRERGRATQPRRIKMACWPFILLFLALGLWPVAGHLQGTSDMGLEGALLVFAIFALFAGLVYLLMWHSLKRRRELYEVMGQAEQER